MLPNLALLCVNVWCTTRDHALTHQTHASNFVFDHLTQSLMNFMACLFLAVNSNGLICGMRVLVSVREDFWA